MAALQNASVPFSAEATLVNQTVVNCPVTVAAGSNRALSVIVMGEGDGTATQAAVVSAVRDGQSCTFHSRRERSDWSWVEIWKLAAPNTGTNNMVVTIDDGGDAFTVLVYVCDDAHQAVTGAGANDVLFAEDGTTGSGTSTGNRTVAGVASDDVLFDALCIDSTGHAAAPGANQTERYDNPILSASDAASSTQAGADGGVMSYSWSTSAPWSYSASGFKNAGGGSLSAALGTAAETDTAPTLGRSKAKAVGTSTSTESAQPLGRLKARALGTAGENDATQAFGRAKAKALGTVAEANTAQALGRAKLRAISQAAETDAAQSLGRLKSKPLGTASETNTALPITEAGALTGTLGTALESDQARPFSRAKAKALTQAGELDTATALGRLKTRAFGTALESDGALTLGRAKAKLLGLALETDSAQAIAVLAGGEVIVTGRYDASLFDGGVTSSPSSAGYDQPGPAQVVT